MCTGVFCRTPGAPPQCPGISVDADGDGRVDGPLSDGPDTRYRDAVLESDPVRWWRLGDAAGATRIHEEVQGVDEATLEGGIQFGVAGLVPGDTAASFDGSNMDCAVIGNPAALQLGGTQDFSIEAWVDVDTPGTSGQIFAKVTSGTPEGYELVVNNTATAVIFRLCATTNCDPLSVPLPTTQSMYVVATYAGGTGTMYVNGELAGSAALAPADAGSTASAAIGCRAEALVREEYFDGVIDEVAIYDHALTSGEVTAHWEATR